MTIQSRHWKSAVSNQDAESNPQITEEDRGQSPRLASSLSGVASEACSISSADIFFSFFSFSLSLQKLSLMFYHSGLESLGSVGCFLLALGSASQVIHKDQLQTSNGRHEMHLIMSVFSSIVVYGTLHLKNPQNKNPTKITPKTTGKESRNYKGNFLFRTV